MSDALTGLRSADPWPRTSPSREREAAELVALQKDAATRLRQLMLHTLAVLRSIEFPLGFPVRGHDEESAAALLAELAEVVPVDEARAYEMTGEDV